MTASPRLRPLVLTFLTGCILSVPALSAQRSPARDTSETHNHAKLFTRVDAAVAAGFVGLTVGMFPIDRSIARRPQHDTLAKGFVDRGATAFELMSVPGAYIIGPAVRLWPIWSSCGV